MDDYIDVCVSYIEDKNANYLAKEGQVVYYTSLTGRQSDQVWVKHSMSETIRIIKSTKLAAFKDLKEFHVLSAFQELGRVYEFAAKSRHAVAEGVFNYYAHANIDMSAQIAVAMTEAFIMRGFIALLGNEVIELYYDILKKLDSYTNTIVERDTLMHVLDVAGYDYRSKSKRVMYKGAKVNAFMSLHSTPSQITQLTREISEQIIRQVHGELK
jgi:hypothetical protein